MATAAIHVVPDDSFDDWVVRGMSGRSSAISPPEKKPSWPPRRSRSGARPNLSFTSLTEERSARVLRRDGWRNSSQDDPTGLPDIPSVWHESQRGDALDGEALQQFRHRVAVALDKPHLRLELGCRLFEDRPHRPAGAAPSCPEIDEQRNVAATGMLVEASGVVQRNRPLFE